MCDKAAPQPGVGGAGVGAGAGAGDSQAAADSELSPVEAVPQRNLDPNPKRHPAERQPSAGESFDYRPKNEKQRAIVETFKWAWKV